MRWISGILLGGHPSQAEPERFYHGFVLGLMVGDRYMIISNRESGFGRYDVVLMPKGDKDDAIKNILIVMGINDTALKIAK